MAHKVTFKFSLKDTVFLIIENKVEKGEIEAATAYYDDSILKITYMVRLIYPNDEINDNFKNINQKYLFKTKQELLDSL